MVKAAVRTAIVLLTLLGCALDGRTQLLSPALASFLADDESETGESLKTDAENVCDLCQSGRKALCRKSILEVSLPFRIRPADLRLESIRRLDANADSMLCMNHAPPTCPMRC